MGAPTAPAICTRSLRSRRPRRSSLNVEPASSWSTQEVASQPERSIEHLAYACRCPTTTRGPGRSAQAQGCIPQMWVIASERALGDVAEDPDLGARVALAEDAAVALLDLGRLPRRVEVVQGDQPLLDVGAGAHLGGQAEQDAHPARAHLIE